MPSPPSIIIHTHRERINLVYGIFQPYGNKVVEPGQSIFRLFFILFFQFLYFFSYNILLVINGNYLIILKGNKKYAILNTILF